jgi:hypothetical protein
MRSPSLLAEPSELSAIKTGTESAEVGRCPCKTPLSDKPASEGEEASAIRLASISNPRSVMLESSSNPDASLLAAWASSRAWASGAAAERGGLEPGPRGDTSWQAKRTAIGQANAAKKAGRPRRWSRCDTAHSLGLRFAFVTRSFQRTPIELMAKTVQLCLIISIWCMKPCGRSQR